VTTADPSHSLRQRFGDALALYDLRAVDSKPLVVAATDLLTEETGGERLVALASKVVIPLTSPFEMDELVATAREEQHMPRLDREQTVIRAAQSQVRRWRRGELTDRQLTSWAHQAIGHEGPDVLQELVGTDDKLDVGTPGQTPESVHAELETIAQDLIAHADPWHG
jgi:hypothetical protein